MFGLVSLLFMSYIILPSVRAYTSDAIVDKIGALPGLSVDINQFSGYITLTGTQKHIHYWFVEAEEANAPLVFWTNGGPGCSGLIGFMTEQGPFYPNRDGNLIPNQYAWNKLANMVFLEQPVGVGFSYSDNADDYSIGDDQAAKDNLATILGFLERFPEFAKTQLFLTSESYGGHYLPTWASAIIDYNDGLADSSKRINFQGFAVGNPYTDYYSGVGAEMETYWGKQLLPKPSWDKYVANGCLEVSQQLNNSACSYLILEFMRKIGNLNPYALDYPVCLSGQQRAFREFIYGTNAFAYGANKQSVLDKSVQSTFDKSVQSTFEPCADEYAAAYLNRADVKAAIHVRSDIVWDECSRTTKYKLADKMLPMEKYYPKILNSKTHPWLRVLVYSGDDDSVCGTIGTQRWIYDLGFSVAKSWDTWYVDGQTAGYITNFKTEKYINGRKINDIVSSRFAFVTVHGAGHEVPTYKPREAFELFRMYLDNVI
jgi:carboxypeptidase C (cathepsin A)